MRAPLDSPWSAMELPLILEIGGRIQIQIPISPFSSRIPGVDQRARMEWGESDTVIRTIPRTLLFRMMGFSWPA